MSEQIKCAPVRNHIDCQWTVQIKGFGGKVQAAWSSDTEVEPNYAELALFLGENLVATHKTGKGSGEHEFSQDYGNGYRLALRANDFQGNKVELASTAVTVRNEPAPPPVSKTYRFEIGLDRDGDHTRLTWSSTAAFRPRQSQARVYVAGQDNPEPWIESANGQRTFDDIRWGVGLSTAYTAEDFSGNRFELVRTPTTGALEGAVEGALPEEDSVAAAY